MEAAMAPTRWRWSREALRIFLAAVLLLGLVAAVLFVEVWTHLWVGRNWPALVLGILATAAALAITSGILHPVGVGIGDAGLRLAYLHRRESLAWPQVLSLDIGIDASVAINTSHRSISLGHPGRPLEADLTREMRRRKRRVRTPMPEDYPEDEGGVPIPPWG